MHDHPQVRASPIFPVADLPRALENYEAYVKAGDSDGDVPAIIEQLKKEIEKK